MKRRILHLCHFDFARPRSGGQKRAAAMHRWLLQSGDDVFNLIIGPSVSSKKMKSELRINTDYLVDGGKESWLLLEYNLMGAPLEVNHPEIVGFFDEHNPSLVVIEHPWLFPLLKRLQQKYRRSFEVVYSSHNVEADLKEQIFLSSGLFQKNQDVIREISSCEVDVARAAKMTICVSERDANWYRESGAPNVVVVANRVDLSKPSFWGSWRYGKNSLREPYAVFIGSPHPPNVSGFLQMLGPNLGFLPLGYKILLVGGVADSLRWSEGFKDFAKTNDKRVVYLPEVSDREIANILSGAVCVLLPIVEGGGTNLKTIEALLSGRKILATSKAFCGHEEFMNDKLVTIVDSPSLFRQALVQILSEPPVKDIRDERFYSMLSWEEQFKKIENSI